MKASVLWTEHASPLRTRRRGRALGWAHVHSHLLQGSLTRYITAQASGHLQL
jgi:hypothetical protein